MALFNHDRVSPLQMVALMLFQAMITIWFFVWVANPLDEQLSKQVYDPYCQQTVAKIKELIQ